MARGSFLILSKNIILKNHLDSMKAVGGVHLFLKILGNFKFFAAAAPTSGRHSTKLHTAQLALYILHISKPRRDPTTDSGDRPRQRFVKCDVIFPEVGRISKKWLEDLF